MRALNIDVPDALLARWVGWFSPAVQPFLAGADLAASIDEQAADVSLTDEVRDTTASTDSRRACSTSG